MPTEVIGRWEELVSRPEFRGHRVKISIIDQASGQAETDTWIESLRRMASDGVQVAQAAVDSRESIYEGRE
jgi:hypothetical protein